MTPRKTKPMVSNVGESPNPVHTPVRSFLTENEQENRSLLPGSLGSPEDSTKKRERFSPIWASALDSHRLSPKK